MNERMDERYGLDTPQERERVLRDLIKKRFGKCGRSGCRAVTGMVNRNFCPDCAAIDAALATRAAEQPAQPKEKAEANKEGKS